MGYGSLAPVLTGWTGTITAVITASNILTITPYTRESVASLLHRLVHEMLVRTGTAPTLTVASTGVITLADWDAAIIVTFSGNCDDRTGFTAGGGIYGGSASYTAAGAFTGGWVPAYGLRLVDPLVASSSSRPTGDGTGGVAAVRVSASSRIDAWHNSLAAADRPSVDYREWDYWHDGRVFGRFTIEGSRFVPLGRQREPAKTRIEFDVQESA